MTNFLDEQLVERVNDLGTTTWSGVAFRHSAAGRDALSGVGARLNGGRWNPRGEFAAIYLAVPLSATMRELQRAADAFGVRVDDFLRARWMLHTVEVTALEVLDLRDPERLDYVGLSPADVEDDDRSACQAVARAAWFLEMQGIIAPSATGYGCVVTAFEGRLAPGQLKVTPSAQLDFEMYERGLGDG